jgi:L-threonylcarbamoyladenylate synthase
VTGPISPVAGGEESQVIARAVAALRAGSIVGIPTDTVYGLAAALDRPDAIARLYALKGRPLEKAIPILLSEPADISLVASAVPPEAERLAARFWPGALTLVVPARPGLPSEVTSVGASGDPTVAVRIPDQQLARAIIAAAGGALAVTSANRSGEAPCRSAAEVAALGSAAPDLVIDGGPVAGGVPSTIVAIGSGGITILREGAIDPELLAEAVGPVSRSATARG